MATQCDDKIASNNDGVINIGLIGEVGSGRSSFVNAFMRFHKKDSPIKVVSPTYTPQCYPHPQEPGHIHLWDLPGVGLAEYPDTRTYFEKLELAKNYHAFLLFCNGKLTINTQRLAVRLEFARKPFFFIRTSIDVDIRNKGINEKKEFVVDEIRKSISDGLEKFSVSGEQIFLISKVDIVKWDFPRLCEEILSPELINHMSTWCERPIAWLRSQLRQLTLNEKREEFMADKETILKFIKENMPKAKRGIEKEGIKCAQTLINEELERERKVKICLAVTGKGGVGKSNFINTIRGIENDEYDGELKVAKSGPVAETRDVTLYPFPDNVNITLADCPGVGSPTIPDVQTFSRKIDIEKYDAFIIMCTERFSANEVNLARKLKTLNKPFFLVRSKIDAAQQSARDDRKPFGAKELQEIKDQCHQSLQKIGCEISKKDIFLISNKFIYKEEWDFPRLNMAIKQRLPVRKQECFLFSMLNLSKDILKQKVDVLKNRVKFVAILRSLKSMIAKPFTSLEILRESEFDLVVEKMKLYRKKLGFLDRDSEHFRKLSSELQKRVKQFYSKNELRSCLEKAGVNRDDDRGEGLDRSTEDGDDEAASWMNVAVQETTYGFVYRSLHCVLDKMGETANEVLEAIARPECDAE